MQGTSQHYLQPTHTKYLFEVEARNWFVINVSGHARFRAVHSFIVLGAVYSLTTH